MLHKKINELRIEVKKAELAQSITELVENTIQTVVAKLSQTNTQAIAETDTKNSAGNTNKPVTTTQKYIPPHLRRSPNPESSKENIINLSEVPGTVFNPIEVKSGNMEINNYKQDRDSEITNNF